MSVPSHLLTRKTLAIEVVQHVASRLGGCPQRVFDRSGSPVGKALSHKRVIARNVSQALFHFSQQIAAKALDPLPGAPRGCSSRRAF
jgi:hypothetical protein